MKYWIAIIIILLLLIAMHVYGHENNCVQDGFRVRHFDVSKPKWGIVGSERGMVHGHEMVHPRNQDYNYLQWFYAVGEGRACIVKPVTRRPKQPPVPIVEPPPEPEVKPPPKPTPEVKPPPRPVPKPPPPIVEPTPDPPVQEPEVIPQRPAPVVDTPGAPAPEVLPLPEEDSEEIVPTEEEVIVETVDPVEPPVEASSRVVLRTTLPKGITLLHIPCQIDGVSRISDVMRVIGDGLFYLISLDAEAQEFSLHLPELPSINDREFGQHEAFIVVMRERVDGLVFDGERLTDDIVLVKGINLVEARHYPNADLVIGYRGYWTLDFNPVIGMGVFVIWN